MKLAEIEPYGEYGFNDGNSDYSVLRCIVVDPRPIYTNSDRHASRWSLETGRDNGIRRLAEAYLAKRPRKGRIAIAVEVPRFEELETNPDTGQPWTDEELHITPSDLGKAWVHPKRTKRLQVGTSWHPYAARPQDLKKPWREEVLKREAEARALEDFFRARIVREAAQAVEDERKREENKREGEQAAKDRAQMDEFYETRLEPALVELEIEHTHRTWANGKGDKSGTITLGFEEMYRLLKKGGLVP